MSSQQDKARRFGELHKAQGLVRRAAVELREQCSFGCAAGQIPDAQLSRFFATYDRS
jgi:hypothetical protein